MPDNTPLVVLSSGLGRLHFVETARSVSHVGVDVLLILGWAPKKADSMVVKIASWFVGRDISAGLRKRRADLDGVCVDSLAFPEILDTLLGRMLQWIGLPLSKVGVWGPRLFGWMTCNRLKGRQIFHVRSGFGQGGAIAAAKRAGLKVIVDHSIAHPAYMEQAMRNEFEQHGQVFTMGPSAPMWRLVLKDCGEADLLLVNSDFVKQTFVSEGYDAAKIRVAYLGVREDFFKLRPARFGGGAIGNGMLRMLFTGYFGFRKGSEYVLRAMDLICNMLKIPCCLDVVGSVEGLERYKKICAEKRLPITFHGPVPQDELKAFLSNSDVYLFPSLSEGCAKSGMEAMSAGLCVIATASSGLPIRDGENGVLVPVKDSEAIARAVSELFSDPKRIDIIGAHAAELIAREYTWDIYGRRVAAIYKEVLAK